MIYVEYVILAGLVVYLSLFLSKYVDALDKKTNLSGAFIGGVLLAAVTSLPEFITSLTAVFSLNQPSLVQGNVFGSNVFNLSVLGACILIFPKKFKGEYLSKSHILTSVFTFIMFIICFLGMKYDFTLKIGIFNVSYASIAILVLYIINITKMNSDESSSSEESDLNLTVKQILLRFTICTILLVIASIALTNVTDRLNEKLNLGATVGGAIFLGIATSLPELTSSFNLVRLGNFNASFGNIIGSNLFNFTILSIADIFYSKGNIFKPDNQAFNLIFWGLVATVFATGTIFSKKNKGASITLAILIIAAYVASIIFSI